ncbi:MAG: tetratricopeptide repeat protein [Polyangiaceae bacterium]|nr:tetratricopeptide repeat protein [Polyangiaceae bacterium]MCW5789230.1 tetratricopeptide repeat protein [Polyangiaceae bacterium]
MSAVDEASSEASSLQRTHQLALTALAAGELPRAASLTLTLLQQQPLNVAYQAQLRRVIALSPDPIALAPLTQPMELDQALLHAFILAELGRHADAAGLLLDVLGAVPGHPTWVWLVTWVRELTPIALRESIGGLTRRLAVAANVARTSLGVPGLGPLLQITRLLAERAPEELELQLFEITLLRQAERPLEAAQRARACRERTPSWRSEIAYAQALRESGELELAAQSLERATQHEPSELSTFLDLGDALLSLGRPPEALAAYRAALALEPDHPWATSSALAADYFLGETSKLDALVERADAGDARASALIGALFHPPWVSSLPLPLDPELLALSAAIEALKQHPAEATAEEPAQIRLELAQLGAPSLQLGFVLGARLLGHQAKLTLAIRHVPKPDPRQVAGQPLFSVWRYHGTSPAAAVPPPSGELRPLIEALARCPYDLDAWANHAAELSRSLPPTCVGELLSSLVHIHPPSTDSGVEALHPMDWVQRVQIAACLLIAQLETSWEGTVREAALSSLCDGPIDWTTNAALVALASVARREPQHEPHVAALYQRVYDRLPTDGSFSCVLHPLASLWASLPGTSPELRGRLYSLRARVEAALRRARAQQQR